jgi:hypothetical protein
MRTIWKFTLYPDNDLVMNLKNPKVLHVGPQAHVGMDDCPQVWIEHDGPGTEPANLTLRAFGTGFDIPDGWIFIGTSVHDSNGLVWHVYSKITK